MINLWLRHAALSASLETNTRMTSSTDTLRHTFGCIDPRLVPPVMALSEQRAMRLVTVLGLAGYALFWQGGLFTPLLPSLLILVGYAVLQYLLSLMEARLRPRQWLSAMITGLDLMLLGWQLSNDPLPSLPTGLLGVLVVGLAALRWPMRAQWLSMLAVIGIAALAMIWRVYNDTRFSWPTLITAGLADLLLMSLLLVMAQLARQYMHMGLNIPGRDAPTGFFNRPTLYAAAELLMPLMHRQHQPMTLLYIVIEPIGLAPGREASPALQDELCGEFADVARTRLRGSDILVRYSPLEFVFLLLDCPSKQADPIAHYLQETFHASRASQQSPATAHIGATWLPNEPMALDQLLNHLDEAMARARHSRIGVSGAIYSDPEQTRTGHQLSAK